MNRFLIILVLCLICASVAHAALNEVEKQNLTPRTVQPEIVAAEGADSAILSSPSGLNYIGAKDRKIERIAGYENMQGLDAYMYHKFAELEKKLDARLQMMELRLSKKIRRLEIMLGQLEEIKTTQKAKQEKILATAKKAAEANKALVSKEETLTIKPVRKN